MSDAAPIQKTRRPAPWRGRNKVEDPRKKFIAVRCTVEERLAITEASAAAGLSIGAFLRTVAVGSAGPRAVRRPPIERKELAQLLGHVGKLSSNVNQIAKGYNVSGVMPGFAEIMAMRADIQAMRAALMKALGREGA